MYSWSGVQVVQEVAANLGLTRLGWIFTDLVPLNSASQLVKTCRGPDTHFLSAQEIITAAAYQNAHPNKSRLTEEGEYGSKFVTVCVTGNKEHEIHMEGYQVTLDWAADILTVQLFVCISFLRVWCLCQ